MVGASFFLFFFLFGFSLRLGFGLQEKGGRVEAVVMAIIMMTMTKDVY